MTETQAFVEISSRSAAELAEKYVALWNEPDADRRRRITHILQPPQEIRGIAAQPGIGLTATLEARGYEEIEARAGSASAEGFDGRLRLPALKRVKASPIAYAQTARAPETHQGFLCEQLAWTRAQDASGPRSTEQQRGFSAE